MQRRALSLYLLHSMHRASENRPSLFRSAEALAIIDVYPRGKLTIGTCHAWPAPLNVSRYQD